MVDPITAAAPLSCLKAVTFRSLALTMDIKVKFYNIWCWEITDQIALLHILHLKMNSLIHSKQHILGVISKFNGECLSLLKAHTCNILFQHQSHWFTQNRYIDIFKQISVVMKIPKTWILLLHQWLNSITVCLEKTH